MIECAVLFQALKYPKHYPLRRIDKILLKGKTRPTYIYEITNWLEQLPPHTVTDYSLQFEHGLTLYEQGAFEEAKKYLQKCKHLYSEDKVVDVLMKRCENFINEPPSKNWDGTFVMKHK